MCLNPQIVCPKVHFWFENGIIIAKVVQHYPCHLWFSMCHAICYASISHLPLSRHITSCLPTIDLIFRWCDHSRWLWVVSHSTPLDIASSFHRGLFVSFISSFSFLPFIYLLLRTLFLCLLQLPPFPSPSSPFKVLALLSCSKTNLWCSGHHGCGAWIWWQFWCIYRVLSSLLEFSGECSWTHYILCGDCL